MLLHTNTQIHTDYSQVKPYRNSLQLVISLGDSLIYNIIRKELTTQKVRSLVGLLNGIVMLRVCKRYISLV